VGQREIDPNLVFESDTLRKFFNDEILFADQNNAI
jgi:hypothetical protein